MKAVAFCEDDYEGCATMASEAEYLAWSRGFVRGASAYGAGKVSVYLLPRDEVDMFANESGGEILKALEDEPCS